MALTILHGDNLFQSRKHLNNILDEYRNSGGKDITRFNKRNLSLESLIQSLESLSFFGSSRLVVVDSLHSLPKSKNKNQLVTYLAEVDSKDALVVLWESKKLTPGQIKKLPNFKPVEYKTSPTIFKFLDALTPENKKSFLPLYSRSCDQDSAEFVFYMLAKRLRQLLLAPSEHLKAAPWQISRLKQQYQSFSQENLLKLHHQLYQLDYRIKSGKTALPLQSELEFILVNI